MPLTDVGTVLYVSKFPPSRSGIALYASVFEEVLQRWGSVRRLAAPSDPMEAQSLRQAVRGFVLGLRLDLSGLDRVQVELSGRSLFEFYFCLGLSLRRSTAPLDITCHDSPAVVGPPALFRSLDRRWLRRVGIGLSQVIGPWTERQVLQSAASVWALTAAGAEALQRGRRVSVNAMPHVVDSPPLGQKQRHIFVPGPLHDPGLLIEVLSRTQSDWPLVVGHCTRAVADSLLEAVDGRIPLCFTGYLSEQELLEQFARAAIVLRLRGSATGDNEFAASGPLSWAITRGCLCLTDDSRAGALELARQGLIVRPTDIPRALDALVASYRDKEAHVVAERTRSVMGVDAVATYRAAIVGPVKRH